MEDAAREMPRYRCHKEVWALKIKAVSLSVNKTTDTVVGGIITPADAGYAPFPVDAEYMAKHDPQPGMYYVTYADGYQSCSPAKAFEEGYTKV